MAPATSRRAPQQLTWTVTAPATSRKRANSSPGRLRHRQLAGERPEQLTWMVMAPPAGARGASVARRGRKGARRRGRGAGGGVPGRGAPSPWAQHGAEAGGPSTAPKPVGSAEATGDGVQIGRAAGRERA